MREMFYTLAFCTFGSAAAFILYQLWFWLKNARWLSMPICEVVANKCWLDSSRYRGFDIIIDWFAHVHVSIYLILLGFVFVALGQENGE